jgi:hypothetical protein
MSPGGPTPTSRDVCFRAAVWGLADMPPAWLIDANDPKLTCRERGHRDRQNRSRQAFADRGQWLRVLSRGVAHEWNQ